MAVTLAGSSLINLGLTYTQTAPPGSSEMVTISRSDSIAYTHGSGASQANVIYTKRVTLASLASQNYDFNSLADPFGTTNNLTKVKRIKIYNESSTSGETFTVSGDLLLAFGTQTNEVVGPRGTFYRESPIDGFTVTNTTQDGLSVLNSGAAENSYYIEVIGVA